MTIQERNKAFEPIVCNMCDTLLNERDLIICIDSDGIHKGCPKCRTDNYLMDI